MTSSSTTSLTSLSSLKQDAKNANLGTVRGLEMLQASLEKLGAGRSIVLDRDGRIVAGNKTAQAAALAGMDDVIVVRTDGSKIVAVQRTDLDLDSPEGRELAIADNRTGEVGLSWSADVLADLQGDGLDLSGLFDGGEIDALLGELSASAPLLAASGPHIEDAGGFGIGAPELFPAGSEEGPTSAPTSRPAPVTRPLGPQGAPPSPSPAPIHAGNEPIKFKEFDESVAEGVTIRQCPACGNRWAE